MKDWKKVKFASKEMKDNSFNAHSLDGNKQSNLATEKPDNI